MARKWKPTEKQQAILSCVGLHWEQDPQEWKWRYGDQLALLHNQSDSSPGRHYYMTSERMIEHVGMLEDVHNDPEAEAFYDSHPNEKLLRQRMAVIEFDSKILAPVRKRLEASPYYSTLYRLPTFTYKIDEKTGLIVFKPLTESTLQLIPLSVEIATLRGVNKTNLRHLASKAIYVILRKKAAYRTIPNEEQLLRYLDGWVALIRKGEERRAILDTFKAKNPILVGERVTQLLLL